MPAIHILTIIPLLRIFADIVIEPFLAGIMSILPQPQEHADMRALDAAAAAACEFLKALASPSRLKILCHLLEGEKSVGQVAALVGIRETAASQHLALLRRDRLVDCRRAGQTVHYRMVSPTAERIIAVLHDAFCPARPGAQPKE